MIDLLAIDRWSATGTSWLHRAPAGAKALSVAGVVALLVALRHPAPLGALYAALLVCLFSTRLPALPLLGLSLVPVAMSGVFAISRMGGGLDEAAVVVLKGAITSLTMLLLVSTTPHTALLRLVRRALPATLAEMLFLGYRSVFILLGRGLAARDALRLRGGAAPWHVRARRGSLVGALAVLRATELASDQYAALRLRAAQGTQADGIGGGTAPPPTLDGQRVPAELAVDTAALAVDVQEALEVRYPDGRTVRLTGEPFRIRSGERVALLGANGSGKSTLLRAVLGLVRPASGTVRVLGHDPAREFGVIRPRLGTVLQDVEAQLLAPTVREDLAFGLDGRGLSKEELAGRVEETARAFGLEHLLDRVPHYLSGGERRKVALAGALITEPELLVLDEPFAGLDPRSRAELAEMLRAAHAARVLSVLLTTHEVEELSGLVDTVYVLGLDGTLRVRGAAAEVFGMEDVLRESNVAPPALARLRAALARRGVTLPEDGQTDLADVEALAEALAAALGERPAKDQPAA